MTDRELLELAAKAAGIELLDRPEVHSFGAGVITTAGHWSPLTDDGDALRLAVKLELVCGFVEPNCWAELPGEFPAFEPRNPDPYAATRRAIVRAAAEIGRGME